MSSPPPLERTLSMSYTRMLLFGRLSVMYSSWAASSMSNALMPAVKRAVCWLFCFTSAAAILGRDGRNPREIFHRLKTMMLSPGLVPEIQMFSSWSTVKGL